MDDLKTHPLGESAPVSEELHPELRHEKRPRQNKPKPPPKLLTTKLPASDDPDDLPHEIDEMA